MSANGSDPTDLIKKLSESYRQIRFGRGVVGKTAHAMIALLAVWLLVVWRWSGSWTDAGLFLIGLAATAVFIWWTRSTQDFAERNPAQALLEGAELLEYQKFEAEAKGRLSLGESRLLEGNPQIKPSGSRQ